MFNKSKPKVYLIGAGPGDPELLTVKAKRLIQQADVVLYDYLVHPNIVMLATHATCICVGKKKGGHSTQQKDIHTLIKSHAKPGVTLVRIKGGDPMIFGRSGEEIDLLKSEGIPFEVVPGVTSAIAVPTYAGFPITLRNVSQSVAFVTATRVDDQSNLSFPNADTLVIMMSLLRIHEVVDALMKLRKKDTPIAIIESGTYAKQRVLKGTLSTIIALQDTHQLSPPALMVVGDVVSHQTDWRSLMPLNGRRFIVTRPAHQQSNLMDPLTDLGAEVISLPCNQITYCKEALQKVDPSQVNRIILTSQNGVYGFFKSLQHTKQDIRQWHHVQWIAIGQQTKNALASFGIQAECITSQQTSVGIGHALADQVKDNERILVPTSSESEQRISVPNASVTIEYVTVYANHLPQNIAQQLQWIQPEDAFILMNAASVHRLINAGVNLKAHQVVSIGPITSATLNDYGVMNIIEADTPSVASVVQCVLNAFHINDWS